MDKKEFQEIANLMERVIHKYTDHEKKTIDYGNGIPVSQPEIQTIMLIDSHPGISVTEIAKMRGITKGTASQMLYRLVDRGFIEKRISEHSDAQLSVYLTELGAEESRLHDEYHKKKARPVYEYLSTLSPKAVKDFVKIFEYLEEMLDED